MPRVKLEAVAGEVALATSGECCATCGFWGAGRQPEQVPEWNICIARVTAKPYVADSTGTMRPMLRTRRDHYCSQWQMGLE
jgi:hypothetical protein